MNEREDKHKRRKQVKSLGRYQTIKKKEYEKETKKKNKFFAIYMKTRLLLSSCILCITCCLFKPSLSNDCHFMPSGCCQPPTHTLFLWAKKMISW